MDSAVDLTSTVKAMAREQGFARVGIAPSNETPGEGRFRQWLAAGMHAGMTYLEPHVRERFHPAALVEGAASVICLAVSYADGRSGGIEPIARYARGRDYHKVLKQRCHALMDRLRHVAGSFVGRAFVDTAPVSERSLAVAAGLGWIGRNGCLIVPGLGSYVLLAEIVCNLPLVADVPLAMSCGACRACVEACPIGACLGDGLIDARRCLSYLTVEHRGPIASEYWSALGGRVLGCDSCQSVCPHNRGAEVGDEPLVGLGFRQPGLKEILAWPQDDWDAFTRGSARRRATYEMYLRNAVLSAGGLCDASLEPLLETVAQACPQLRPEIDWALSRLRDMRDVADD